MHFPCWLPRCPVSPCFAMKSERNPIGIVFSQSSPTEYRTPLYRTMATWLFVWSFFYLIIWVDLLQWRGWLWRYGNLSLVKSYFSDCQYFFFVEPYQPGRYRSCTQECYALLHNSLKWTSKSRMSNVIYHYRLALFMYQSFWFRWMLTVSGTQMWHRNTKTIRYHRKLTIWPLSQLSDIKSHLITDVGGSR